MYIYIYVLVYIYIYIYTGIIYIYIHMYTPGTPEKGLTSLGLCDPAFASPTEAAGVLKGFEETFEAHLAMS